MEEMRNLIAKRQIDGTPRARPCSLTPQGPTSTILDTPKPALLGRLEESINDADQWMARAAASHETLQDSLTHVLHDLTEVRPGMNRHEYEDRSTVRVENDGIGADENRVAEYQTPVRARQKLTCRRDGREGDHVRGGFEYVGYFDLDQVWSFPPGVQRRAGFDV